MEQVSARGFGISVQNEICMFRGSTAAEASPADKLALDAVH